MKTGKKIKIMIAEPWDFEGPNGPNEVHGKVCDSRNGKYGKVYLVKAKNRFVLDGIIVEYMVLSCRNITASRVGLNICYIPSEKVARFKTLSSIELQKLAFIMIGSVEL
ncbi:MAG: hypothetical protein LBD23_01770 [Oscillospiraceae bacterium]|nr:hypothetical protein [Oscillospiraceae bacterium]